MPYLELGQQSRSLGPGVLSIGSGAEAGWRIREHDLARLHALFMLERDGRVLLTRGSPDVPVAINGVELGDESQYLQLGDRVRLGSIEFAFVESSSERAATNDGYLRDTRRDRLYKLTDVNDIGRDAASSIQLLEPKVSRHHAEVRWEGGAYMLAPRAAAVTLLNGGRLSAPAKLNEGDVVTIGRTTMQFSTSLPPNSAREDGMRRRADPRVMPARTSFTGAFESHRRLRRSHRKRVGKVAAVALVAAALLAALVTAWERSLASPRGAAAGGQSSGAAQAATIPR